MITKELAREYMRRFDDLTENFRWKAENNIRFYENLNMATAQKVDFLAKEFAGVYELGFRFRLETQQVLTEVADGKLTEDV